MEDYDYGDIQEYLDEILGETEVHFTDLMQSLMSGDFSGLVQQVGELLRQGAVSGLNSNGKALRQVILTALFGAFLMALAAYFLFFAKRVKMQPSLTAGLVCSAFSGCCAGAFTIGGPMMALYFVAIARDKETYVGNMQFLFMVTNLINFTMRAVRGYFRAELLPVAGVSIVCILAGLWIGTRLSRRMSGDVARQVVYIGVGVSGLVTLAQELLK